MKKLLAALLLISGPALGQSYPSPTYLNLTLTGALFLNQCTGPVIGNGSAAATCTTVIPNSNLPIGNSGATLPLMSAINTWSGLQTFALLSWTGHPYGSGTAPTLSACGTSPSLSTGANDTHGTITTGTASPTSCTLTWAAAYTNTPDCSIDSPGGTTINSFVPTAATLVINFPGTSSAKFTYICHGN